MLKSPERASFFLQAPVILSEIRLDFSELFRTNQSIVSVALAADTDIFTKVSILERLLPGLAAAGDCACSCSCQCSCACS